MWGRHPLRPGLGLASVLPVCLAPQVAELLEARGRAEAQFLERLEGAAAGYAAALEELRIGDSEEYHVLKVK